MNEETYLKETIGTRNPFQVPEGYFEQLTQQVMQQLPERKPQSRLVALRPWLYAAACVVVLVVMSLSLYLKPDAGEQQVAVASVESTYMDDAADYAMIDNSEIYACLTSDN